MNWVSSESPAWAAIAGRAAATAARAASVSGVSTAVCPMWVDLTTTRLFRLDKRVLLVLVGVAYVGSQPYPLVIFLYSKAGNKRFRVAQVATTDLPDEQEDGIVWSAWFHHGGGECPRA